MWGNKMIYVSYICDDSNGSTTVGGSMIGVKKPKTWDDIENIKNKIESKENVTNIVIIGWNKM
jgi:hypothetical protein